MNFDYLIIGAGNLECVLANRKNNRKQSKQCSNI